MTVGEIGVAFHVRVAGQPCELLRLPASGSFLIGRGAPASVVLNDTFLSRSHFSVECAGSVVSVTDAGSRNGLFVNGVRLRQALLRHGDAVCAGKSFLRFTALTVDGKPVRPIVDSPADLTAAEEGLVSMIRESANYVLLDGAIDAGVLEVLKTGGAFFQSLYEGEQAASVAHVGPYFVDLKGAPELLSHVVQRGWGRAWGVWLHTSQSFAEARHQLRRLLTVRSPEGRSLLFRFYDPRVLRVFLRTASEEQRRVFFGSFDIFLLEGSAAGEIIVLSLAGERRLLL